MKDFYYILGTDVNCTLIEIKEAYRKLSKKFHPDLNPNDKYFESRFREIQEAYETLSNPIRRKQYDRDLNNFKSRQNTRKPPGEPYQPRPSTNQKSATRGIDIGFTIVLILITLVFGSYVLKAISNSTPAKVYTAPVITTASFNLPKHHKKKHNLKIKNISITDTPKAHLPIANIRQIKPAPPDTNKKPDSRKNSLYTTIIRSNITGVTYMRKLDNYSSAVIQVIPTNSQVAVLEKGNYYYKVLYNNDTGYVPKWTLKTK